MAGLETADFDANGRRFIRFHVTVWREKMALRVTPIETKTLRFGIVSTAPMIQHAWSEKGLRMMRMTAAERRKIPKTARSPEEEAKAALYLTSSGGYGIPLLGFKASMISAAHKDVGLEKTLVRKSLFFPDTDGSGCIAIEADDPEIREDIVRVGANQTDLRYRPMFKSWRAIITCEIDANALSEQDIINLVDRAGFGVGLCEWRPEKGGEFGRFKFDSTLPLEKIG